METKLLALLQMSPEKYEALVLDNYLLWCNLNSHNDQDCQKLLANTALFNWWQVQYQQLEDTFIQDAKEYHGHCHKRVMRTFYAETTIKIGIYWPKALIEAARKQQPLTPQYN